MPSSTLRTPDDLVSAGLAPAGTREGLARVAARYAVAVTPEVAALVDRADPDDPIARQFVPNLAELDVLPEERADPIADLAHSPLPGLVHRYAGRVLLKPTHACPVYCRFCFRREMVGPGGRAMSAAEIAAALDYVRARPEIHEVIVTGGDPFLLSPRRIAALTWALAAIPHVEVVRWHTRVPLVDPGRVTPALVRALRAEGVATYVAVHANHAREFTTQGRAALARLADGGVPLVSQSVLLRGVNDDAATLAALMRAFVANRVKPYYLHHPDLAPGTSHFRITLDEGRALVAQLRAEVSGLAMPAYVLDVPDGAGKVPVGPDHARRTADGWEIETAGGEPVVYPPPPLRFTRAARPVTKAP